MILLYICMGMGVVMLVAALLLLAYMIVCETHDEHYIISDEAVWIMCCMLICGCVLLGSASLSEAMMLGGSA